MISIYKPLMPTVSFWSINGLSRIIVFCSWRENNGDSVATFQVNDLGTFIYFSSNKIHCIDLEQVLC